MLINTLNILTELSLYLLMFGITFSNSATEIFSVAIIVFFVIRRIALKKFSLPKTAINPFLYALCAVIFVTFLRSSYFDESIRGLIRIIKFAFLFLALVEFFGEDNRRIERAFWAFIVTASLAYLNGIFQSVYGFDIIRHKDLIKNDYLRRISGAFTHPNDFGGYIIFLLPLALCFLCKGLKRNGRIFLILNCLVGAYCLLKTSSRSAWLGLAVGIIIYFFFYDKRTSFAVPLVLMAAIMLTPHGIDRILSLFAPEQNTVWERTQLWKGTWQMVKEHPVLGFGINTFSRYFPLFKPPEYPDLRYTHNSYLQMWSEIGIIGLISFLSIVFVTLKVTLKGLKQKMTRGLSGLILLGLLTGYIAFMIQAGLDTNLFSLRLTTLFWVMTAYMMSVNKKLENSPGLNK